MLAEIITIGDEILIGQTIDTNSAWIGKQLNNRGVDVIQITSIQDTKTAITNVIKLAISRADLILMTGGLGPTKDDITKKTLADYYNVELIQNEVAMENIRNIFERKGRTVLQDNIDQALVPSNCTIISNSRGTAPGMVFKQEEYILVSMPGVPYEMKTMMEKDVLPMLDSDPSSLTIEHHTITVVDVPESIISHSIAEVEENLPPFIKLAYLPHLNLVRLRLTAKSYNKSASELKEAVHLEMEKIAKILGNVWFDGDRNLSEIIGHMLIKAEKTIGTVESCSGGYLAHMLTSVPGSSAYFEGSLLTYSYAIKTQFAGVDPDTLLTKGAVSEEIAQQLAENGRVKLGVDYCIVTTGIAGPGGGTETKPVGLVYIGLAHPDGKVDIKECNFRGSRLQVIERTAYTALNMLRKVLGNP